MSNDNTIKPILRGHLYSYEILKDRTRKRWHFNDWL